MTAKPRFDLACRARCSRWPAARSLAGPGDRQDQGRRARLVAREAERAATKRRRRRTAEQADAGRGEADDRRSRHGHEAANAAGSTPKAGQAGAAAEAGQAARRRRRRPATLAPKDQALDDLLGKLGETKDEPAARRAPAKPGAGAGEPSRKERDSPAKSERRQARRQGQGARRAARGADRPEAEEEECRRRRAERAGRRDHQGDEGRRAAAGQARHQRRHAEEAEADRQAHRDADRAGAAVGLVGGQADDAACASGRAISRASSTGDQTGALARGAPPMKPAKPTSQHSTAGGKDIWGHLPAELRQVMENSFKETALDVEGGADQPLFSLGRQGKARPGGVTPWPPIGHDRGRCARGTSRVCSRWSSARLRRRGRGAGAGRGPGEVGRGFRRGPSGRRARRHRSR